MDSSNGTGEAGKAMLPGEELSGNTNRNSKRMSRMDKDKRRSIMVSLREIQDSPMFVDFSSLDSSEGREAAAAWASLPAVPSVPSTQVPLKDHDEAEVPAGQKKNRKSAVSSVLSRISTASGDPAFARNSKAIRTSSTVSAASVSSAGSSGKEGVRPGSSTSLSLPAVDPLSPTNLESTFSGITGLSSSVDAAERRRSKRTSILAEAPLPKSRVRSGVVSYPILLPEETLAEEEEGLSAEDILSGKDSRVSAVPSSVEQNTSALSDLLSPVQPDEADQAKSAGHDDDVLIIEDDEDDDDVTPSASTPADETTSTTAVDATDSASIRTAGTGVTSTLSRPGTISRGGTLSRFGPAGGYSTLSRVPPPSVKQVLHQPAIATSTLSRTLAARMEHQASLPRRTGSTGMGTLTRSFTNKSRSGSMSSDHAPSQLSLSRPGTPQDDANGSPAGTTGRGRKVSDAPPSTLVRNRSRKGSELRAIATTAAANAAAAAAAKDSSEGGMLGASVMAEPMTMEPPGDDDDFQYPSASPTSTLARGQQLSGGRGGAAPGSPVRENSQSGTLRLGRTIARTLSDAASMLTAGGDLTDEERAAKRKFAEAVRNLNWGAWKKGIDALETLAKSGDERALEFLDPVKSRFKNPTGCYFMGKHFEEVRGEDDVALAWYAIGAHGGYPAAMLNLASFLSRGKGTDGNHPNLGLAMKWYHAAHSNPQLATPQVLAEAAEGIGRLYAEGSASLSLFDEQTLSRKSAPAPLLTTDEDGDGVIVRDLELAEDDGEANLTPEELDAKWANLPDELASKRVIRRDLILAALWFRRAAARGHAGAKAYLSSMMEMQPHVAYSEAVDHLTQGRWRRGVEGMMSLVDGAFEPAERFIDPKTSSLRFAPAMQWLGVHFASLAARERAMVAASMAASRKMQAAAAKAAVSDKTGKETGKEDADDEDDEEEAHRAAVEAEITKNPLVLRYDAFAAGWFRRGAEGGDAGCAVRLAAWLVEGHPAVGGKPDRAQAMAWYHRAWSRSGSGPAEAAEGIGRLYAEGDSGKQVENDDSPEVQDEEDKDDDDNDNDDGEAKGDNPFSPGNSEPPSPTTPTASGGLFQKIGSSFRRTRSVRSTRSTHREEDPNKVDWFRADPTTLTGLPIAINLSRAARWYSRAAYKGSLRAEAALGFLLLEGGGNLKQDLDQAMYHLARAAKGGVPFAMRMYGECLMNGLGTRADDVALGREWIRRANETSSAAYAAARADVLGADPPSPVVKTPGAGPEPSAPEQLLSPQTPTASKASGARRFIQVATGVVTQQVVPWPSSGRPGTSPMNSPVATQAPQLDLNLRSPVVASPAGQAVQSPAPGGAQSLTLRSIASNNNTVSRSGVATSSPTTAKAPQTPLTGAPANGDNYPAFEPLSLSLDFSGTIERNLNRRLNDAGLAASQTGSAPSSPAVRDFPPSPTAPMGVATTAGYEMTKKSMDAQSAMVYQVEDDRVRMMDHRGVAGGNANGMGDIEMGQLGAFDQNVVPEGKKSGGCCVIL
ncbi:hypothetical protein HDU96_002363 [Phlyctochytrium bullatum]|nr:hypothetical protein HDU96_002363 [Phlyctochytrium bullatum]